MPDTILFILYFGNLPSSSVTSASVNQTENEIAHETT